MKTIDAPHQPVTLERLEHGLAVAAYIVTLDGPIAAPIFERLERELATMRADQDTVNRARQLLETYRTAGGVKAIR
jgi:hypothetical protein